MDALTRFASFFVTTTNTSSSLSSSSSSSSFVSRELGRPNIRNNSLVSEDTCNSFLFLLELFKTSDILSNRIIAPVLVRLFVLPFILPFMLPFMLPFRCP